MSLDSYMREVNKTPLLTREEEQELGRKMRKGNKKAGHELVTRNLRFAIHQAHRYRKWVPASSFEDLVQEANMGLVRALDKFDPERGIRFCSYAVWWIRARMMGYIIANSSLVKIGTTQLERTLFTKVREAYARARAAAPYADRYEVLERVAEDLDAPVKAVTDLLNRSARDLSLNAAVTSSQGFLGSVGSSHEPSETTFLDLLPDAEPRADERVLYEQQLEIVHRAMKAASRTPREHFIITRRFTDDRARARGEKVPSRWTLAQLAKRLSLSRERVRQIQNGVIDRAAKQLGTSSEFMHQLDAAKRSA